MRASVETFKKAVSLCRCKANFKKGSDLGRQEVLRERVLKGIAKVIKWLKERLRRGEMSGITGHDGLGVS